MKDCSQATEQKDAGDRNLFPSLQLQPPQPGDGQHQDNDIGKYIRSGNPVREIVLVDATPTFDAFVPEIRHRLTQEDDCDDQGNAPQNHADARDQR